MPLLGWFLALWAVVLFLYAFLLVHAFRRLRDGAAARTPRWTRRRLKSRRDTYFTIGMAGMAIGIFIQSPFGPWVHILRTLHLADQYECYIAPMILLPVILLVIARSVEVKPPAVTPAGTAATPPYRSPLTPE